LFSIRTKVVSKKTISPGREENKLHAIKIETFTLKKPIITFLKFFENKGIFVIIIKKISNNNNIIKSMKSDKIKAIMLSINTKAIFVTG